jgi:peroxiredoxin
MHTTVVALLVGALASSLIACSGGQSSTASPTGGSSETSASGSGPSASSGGSSAKGSAPDFTLPSLDGKNISLSDYAGKSVVLIDFWSTTCDPCLVEMPHIVAIYEKFKAKGFIVLAVSLDGPETRSQVSAVVHDKKMTFPVLLDEETSVVARYNPKKDMPFSVLIDKNGNIVKKMSGYNPGDEEKLAQEVEKLLQ